MTDQVLPLDVLVVGVANVDLVTRVSHLPKTGETAFGTELAVMPGGKGLNQAIAVAQQGGRVALVAKAGDDGWGRLLKDALRAAGVDTAAFNLVPGGRTAAVLVQVPDGGDSAVTVTRTATTLHTLAEIELAQSFLNRAAVTVVQLELDSEVVDRAVDFARGKTIGMLAPRQPMSTATLATLHVLVVNAAEAGVMLGRPVPGTSTQAEEAAAALIRLGPATAVVTFGAGGAAYADGVGTATVPAPMMTAVDTTGAGDTFLGVLSLALARGENLHDAVATGVQAGAQAVQYIGAVAGW
jgi:ribokinase